MKEKNIHSHDGVPLNYVFSEEVVDGPWIVFVIPFGLKLHHVKAFFDFFKAHYNIFAWQARLILETDSYQVESGQLTVDNHAQDMLAIMDELQLDEVTPVGYCSGAGVALAAINMAPHRFNNLVLVNGEYTLMSKPDCVTQFASDIDNLLPIASQSQEKAKLILDKIKSNTDSKPNNLPKDIDLAFTETHYLHRYGMNYLSYRDYDFEALANQVKLDTFIVAGEKDEQVNIRSAKTINDLIENSELYIDEQGDHYEILRSESKTLVEVWNYLSMRV